MPIFHMYTNMARREFPAHFQEELTQLFQRLMQTPMNVIWVHVIDGCNLALEGKTDPCALMYIRSKGHVDKAVNEKYTQEIQGFINKRLGIALERQVLCIAEFKGENVGFGGHLF